MTKPPVETEAPKMTFCILTSFLFGFNPLLVFPWDMPLIFRPSSCPLHSLFYACVFPCIHIFHCIYTYYDEECSRSEGLALLNQLFPIIKKDYESKVTLISSLIMWLLFLSFSNQNFSFPQFPQHSAAFETQFSLLNTLPNESCSIYHHFHFFVILLVFFPVERFLTFWAEL